MNKILVDQSVIEQALEALCQLHFAATERDKKNRVRWFDKAIDESVEAITVLREALDNPEERGTNRYEGWVEVAEQAEQEPVGIVEGSGEWGIAGVLVAGVPIGTKLYAAPVRTKDLTDDEIAVIVRKAAIGYAINRDGLTSHRIARAAIAADREKNK